MGQCGSSHLDGEGIAAVALSWCMQGSENQVLQ